MGIYGDNGKSTLEYLEFMWDYPLVNVYKKLWKDPPFSRGKLAISTGPFSIAILT